jgi:MFS family permease
VIVLSLWRVPESRNVAASSIDWVGALIVTAGLAGVTYGFIESSNRGWKNPSVWGTLMLGCLCLIVFADFEAHARSPMVPLDLFRSRDFTGANLITLFLYAPLGIFFFLYPLNLIQVQHYSATATGAAALPLILLMFLLSRWSGGLVGRFGPKRPLIVGPLIAAVGFILFVVPSVGGSYWTTFSPAFVVLGFGMAVSVAPLTTVVMSAVEKSRAGTASGINNAVARLAGLLAIAILGIVMVTAFSHRLNRRLPQLGLPLDVTHSLETNEIRLAALAVPKELDLKTAASLRSFIEQGFVFGFRLVMLMCAGLAVASSGFAWRTIGAEAEL